MKATTAILYLALIACSSHDAETVSVQHVPDSDDTKIIHKPPGDCPPGWQLLAKEFTEKTGETEDACIRVGTSGAMSIDVLKPGESAAAGALVQEPPTQPTA
jgi:hypothetical protein